MNWHHKLAVASLAVMAAGTSAWAQSPHIITPPDQVIAVKAGHLFDPKIGDMLTNQVVLKLEVPSAETKDPLGNARIGASATTRIKRSDFGLTWNAALETGGFLVGDNLKIELEVSLIRA